MRAESLRPAAAPAGRSLADTAAIAGRFLDNIETVVHGKRAEIELVLTALACEGHVLLEDVPGTAKTVLARAIAGSVEGATLARIQCTPDLQPTDVTGLAVFDQREREFEFRPGPIFAHIVLVDEINRAMPKTQAALLEAMAERQVTVDGVTRPLPEPFLLLATENPIEHEGTFPLPEAQVDRFFLKTSLGYPGTDERAADHPRPAPRAPARTAPAGRDRRRGPRAAGRREGGVHRRAAAAVDRPPRRGDARARRQSLIGASVRGSLALERAARARALLARARVRRAVRRRGAARSRARAPDRRSRRPSSPRRAGSARARALAAFRGPQLLERAAAAARRRAVDG